MSNQKLYVNDALHGQIWASDPAIGTVDGKYTVQGASLTKYKDVGGRTFACDVAWLQGESGLNPNIVYRTSRNGIFAEWQLDLSDNSTVDDGFSCIVTADGKRLKRVFQYFVNVREFYAVGDGVATAGNPDFATGTDDTAAIQACFDFVSSQVSLLGDIGLSGSVYTVYFPKGTYIISDTITIGRYIVAIGDYATIFNNDPTKDSFVFADAYQNSISRIKFRSGKKQVTFTNANQGRTRLNVEECWFSGAKDYCVYTMGTWATDVHMSALMTIKNCHFWRNEKCIHNVCDNMNITDLWLTIVMADNTAPIVNLAGVMTIDRGIGVGQFGERKLNVRWIDNYESVIVKGFKFGAEGTGTAGFVPVYNFGSTTGLWNGANTVTLDGCLIRINAEAGFTEPVTAVYCIDLPMSIKIINNRQVFLRRGSEFQPVIDCSSFDLPSKLASSVNYRDLASFVEYGNSGDTETLKWRSLPYELLPYSNWAEFYFRKVFDVFLTNLSYRDRNILVDTSARANNNISVLPVSTARNTVFVKKTSSDVNVVTVNVQGGGTIDGATSHTLNAQGDFIEVVPGDTEYHIVASRITPAP